MLSIVEATPFKELTHLALRVRPAHDGALKVSSGFVFVSWDALVARSVEAASKRISPGRGI